MALRQAGLHENVEVIRDDRRQTAINDVCNVLGIRRI
jgi:hypothetical protein